MKKIYYLSTCDTCKRILNELAPLNEFEFQDIKSDPITTEQLEDLKDKSGSYLSLFNKRARLYRERNLNVDHLTEKDLKALLLEHYTFLKRPVIQVGASLYVGNSKHTVALAKEKIHS
ncbi:arsenate reductase family protein [Eudoraea chungangensis]|uniref:arsenate reductase family protein n=1 Tax=Eudoraea chungangensis TaxID=1481905 RepID=UPI0023EE09C7|nr:ArsC/Spx/MgsR family protein [Eudoraea chungangensis]